MKNYLLLRQKIYLNELKQMLPSLGQLFTFLMLILYLAIPAAILTALISLSVIADVETPMEQRIIYQWAYFILVYFLIRIQKKAILAQTYQHYLSSLPISTALKTAATLLLTIAAGNLPLIAPLFLLGYLPDWTTLVKQLHFPLFSLSVLTIAWLSLKHNSIPVISLLIAPLLSYLAINESIVSAVNLNIGWLFILIIELYFEPLAQLKNKQWQLRSYWQIRWISIIKSPATFFSRFFFCAVFVGLVAYVQYHVGEVAILALQMLSGWVLALIIGSFQFDNEAFYQQHPHYLKSLFNHAYIRYLYDSLPALLLTTIVCLALNMWLGFSLMSISVFPLAVMITIISVSKYNRNFFILPSIFYSVVLFSMI
ncbi:DUF6136 family protein [Colwelliaceae bacterium 6441]